MLPAEVIVETVEVALSRPTLVVRFDNALLLNLNILPDENLYSMSSWESSFMARPIVWLVVIRISGDTRRWHSLLLTSSTQSPPQRNTRHG